MANYSAGSASITIGADTSGLAREIREDLERIQVEYDIDVGADLDRFRDRMAELRAETTDIEIGVDLDEGDARARLDELGRDHTVTIDVDVDDAGAEARLDELSRDRRVRIDVDRSSLDQARSGADAASSSLNAMAAIKFGALAAGILALTPALLGVAGAAGGAGAAIGAIGAAGLIGSGGIVDAFKAMGQEATGAGSAAKGSADEVEAAQDRVKDALEGVRDAHDDVADAQAKVVDAEASALDAQRELNASYEEATRYLRDMNDQLVDSQLAQERAEISLTQAQERRNEVYSDPSRYNQTDRLSADLSVKEAQQRLNEAKSRAGDQARDTAAANRNGLNGTPVIVAAQQKVNDAQRGVVDAKDGVGDAQERLNKANEQLAKAREELAKAGATAASGAGGVDKFAEAMAKLSPNAREFVLSMQALKPAWDQLKNAVQDNLFAGLGASVTQFANQNLPRFQQGLSQVAGYMNGTFQQTLLSLTHTFDQLSANGTMQMFINGIGKAMSGMAPMISGFASAMITMGATVGPAMGPLFTSLGSFAETVAPALGGVGAQLAQTLTTLMPTLGQFISALSIGLQPVLPVLGQVLQEFMKALIPALPALSEAAQTMGGALVTALQAVAPLLPTIAQHLPQIVAGIVAFKGMQALTGVVTSIREMAGALQLVKVATAAWTAVQWLLNAAMNANPIGLIVIALAALAAGVIYAYRHSETFRNIVQAAWQGIQQAASYAWNNIIKPVMDALVQAFQWAWAKAQEMATNVGQAWTTLQNGIQTAKDWIGARVNDIVGFFTGLPARIKNAVAGAWDGLKDAFKGALNWIISAWNNFSITVSLPKILGGASISIDTPNLPLLKRAGGAISGPGGPKDDVIPILASNGEYMIQASSVSKYGVGMLNAINAGKFADGGPVGYGLPTGGGGDFPQWVHDLEAKNAVKASTYAGHQESDRNEAGYAPNPQHLNRGIDWGGSVDAMQKFAEWLLSIAPSTTALEQIIWMNPNTGQKIGWHGRTQDDGSYFANDYGGHTDHVHTRQSGPIGEKPFVNPYNNNPNGAPGADQPPGYSVDQLNQQDGRNDPQQYALSAPAPGASKTADQKSYPTSFSGWAGFVAQQLVGGQVSDTLGVYGINDSPAWLSAGSKALQDRDKYLRDQGLQNPNGSTSAPSTVTTNIPQTSTPSTTPSATTTTPSTSDQLPQYLPVQPDAKPPAPAAPNMPVNTPEGNIAAGSAGAKQAVFSEWAKYGWQSGNLWLDTLRLVNGESSWNPSAANPGSTAQGLFQFLDTTRAQYPYGSTAAEQAVGGGQYIKNRYGDPSKAWAFWSAQSPHWYHQGGEVAGYGDVPSWLEGGEYVVRREAAQANMPILESINARRPLPRVARQPASAGVGGGHYGDIVNISTARVEDAFLQDQQRRDRRAAMAINRWS